MDSYKHTQQIKALAVGFLIFFIILTLASISCGQVQAQTWGKLYHGPWTEWYTGTTFNGTLPTSDGGYLLTGTSNNRGVILRVSSDGTLLWSRLVQGHGYQRDTSMVSAVEASNGDFIVTGQVHADQTTHPKLSVDGSWDIVLIRLAPTGETVWQKVYRRRTVGGGEVQELPQYIYKKCAQDGTNCKYIVTGVVYYSNVPGCPYSGYRASQVLAVDDSGNVRNSFLLGGPSSTGDGAVRTVLTSEGHYLVLTELFYGSTGLYTTGLQKYGPTGSLLWSRSYYEAYHKEDGDHLLKISAGGVVDTPSGYVIAGGTYYSFPGDPVLGAYYHFKVDKATGSTVAWSKKYRAWRDWESLWVLNFTRSPDGGLLATVGDGVTTANDRIFKTYLKNGDLWWAREYGAHLGSVTPVMDALMVTSSAYNATLAKLTTSGTMAESCTALPIAKVSSETTPHPVLRTEVLEGYTPSGCNAGIGKAAAYAVDLIEAGEYHQANRCAPFPELSAQAGGDFGKVNVQTSRDLVLDLSNYNGLSPLRISNVRLSGSSSFTIVSDDCSGKTLYPVNAGTPISCTATVRFSPGTNGLKKGSVEFVSNNDQPIKAAIQGTGTGAATISGTVRTAAGPLAGVTVSVGGAATMQVTTRADGTYKLTPLPDGAYTITPTKNGYAFLPVTRSANVNIGNITGKDFTGTPKAAVR